MCRIYYDIDGYCDEDGVCDQPTVCDNYYNNESGTVCDNPYWVFGCPWGSDLDDDTGRKWHYWHCDGLGACLEHNNSWILVT